MDGSLTPSGTAFLVAALALACFAFAAGVFATLSFVEKPVWPLMRDPASPRASDRHARLVHGQLNRMIDLLPPIMIVTMASALVLILLQLWVHGFAAFALAVVGVYLVMQGWLVARLRPRIAAVKAVASDTGDIGAVRRGLGRLAVLHHGGLLTAATLAALQLAILVALFLG